MEYRIEERYFFDGRSEFLPQYKKEDKDLWSYFIDLHFNGDKWLNESIKFSSYSEALQIINKDKENLSDPLTIIYHDIKNIK